MKPSFPIELLKCGSSFFLHFHKIKAFPSRMEFDQWNENTVACYPKHGSHLFSPCLLKHSLKMKRDFFSALHPIAYHLTFGVWFDKCDHWFMHIIRHVIDSEVSIFFHAVVVGLNNLFIYLFIYRCESWFVYISSILIDRQWSSMCPRNGKEKMKKTASITKQLIVTMMAMWCSTFQV